MKEHKTTISITAESLKEMKDEGVQYIGIYYDGKDIYTGFSKPTKPTLPHRLFPIIRQTRWEKFKVWIGHVINIVKDSRNMCLKGSKH